jgi:epoxyqueuosine reductase
MDANRIPDIPDIPEMALLADQIRGWASTLGFDAVGITDTDLADYRARFERWLNAGHHGEMQWLERHADLRLNPALLEPDTCRVISVRMPYLADGAEPLAVLADPSRAYISRYALGRDYHRVVRQRLARLARMIDTALRAFGPTPESRDPAVEPASAASDPEPTSMSARSSTGAPRFRAFTDSAPVLEKALGEKAGLGWIGKHTLLLDAQAGSWFFLGEIFTNVPLPITKTRASNACGACRACMTVCPTGAIIAPHQLDARRCIAYLTIEHPGSIPEPLRPLIGNRIFGCDDCQLYCPWNRFATRATLADFAPRHGLDRASLLDLFAWDEADYLRFSEGSALRRAGYQRWQRNLAVALGNGPATPDVIAALRARRDTATAMVREHIDWALARLTRSA